MRDDTTNQITLIHPNTPLTHPYPLTLTLVGNGFRALGAATICTDVKTAAIPFDKRRRGMILGAGGIGT